jgi:hypothetical protein
VSVCLAICFRISQRILSKLGGNIPWYMTRWWAIHCACARNARMCAFTYFWMEYLQTCWEYTATSCMGYVRFMFKHSARVVKRSLIFKWIISKFAENILRITKSCIGYVFFMFKNRTGVCERACTSERMRPRA